LSGQFRWLSQQAVWIICIRVQICDTAEDLDHRLPLAGLAELAGLRI
jgi:hypothetical protein